MKEIQILIPLQGRDIKRLEQIILSFKKVQNDKKSLYTQVVYKLSKETEQFIVNCFVKAENKPMAERLVGEFKWMVDFLYQKLTPP